MENNEQPEKEEKLFSNEEDNKEGEIQFSQIYQKDDNINQKIDSSLQNNLFATKVFMKSIDLRCEDHLTKFQEDVEATRFCQKCNILVCDSCVIDFHIDHIELAKKKVDDYFIQQKNNIIDLRNKVQDSIKYKINQKEIDKVINSQKKLVEDFFARRGEEWQLFIKKLNNLQNLETEIKNSIIKSIEIFYKDECFKRLQSPIEKNEILSKKIEIFIKEWAQYNKREKVVALKNNVIEEFKKETENNLNIIQEEMKNFKGKSLDIEKKVNGIIDIFSKDDKVNELNKIYSEMNDNCLNILKDINELKYDKLTIQKLEDIKNKKIDVDYDYKELLKDKLFNNNIKDIKENNNNIIKENIDNIKEKNDNNIKNDNPNNNIPQKNMFPPEQKNNPPQYNNSNNYINNLAKELDESDKLGEFNIFNSLESGDIRNVNNNFINNNNNKINTNSNTNNINNNMNNYSGNNNIGNYKNNNDNLNNPYSTNNNVNNKLNNPYSMNNNNVNNNPNMNQINQPQMGFYPQNQQIKQENEVQFNYELIIFLKEDKIFAYNEKNGLFSLKLNGELSYVPDKSRFVNIGQAALLTGGKTRENNVSKKCYLISLLESDSSQKPMYSVNISPYGDLQEGRERHNLIYLPNKNSVFACGGFFSKSCEYTDVYKGTWELISPMNRPRGNASMAYVNDRFIYIIGGFELRNEDVPKGYYLDDIEYFDVNNFANGWKIINFLNPNRYNLGLTALGVVPISKSIFLICGGYDGREYKNIVYKVNCNNYLNPIVEQTLEINNPTIFTHNMFCKIRKSYFNFDYQGQMYGSDYENWRFGMLNMNLGPK